MSASDRLPAALEQPELGVWQRVNDALRPEGTGATVSVDATICNAHRAASSARGSADEGVGVSRGGITS